MSFKTYRVQLDSTATLSCAMSGTVNDKASLQLIHKVEDTFILSSNHSTSSPSTTPTSVPYFSLPNPPPSPIWNSEKLLNLPFKDPSNDFMSQLTKQLICEISS